MLGRTHPLVQRVRSLRRDRRERDEEGVFVAEGIHLAQEALRSGADVEIAVVSPAAAASSEGETLLELLAKAGVRVEEVSESVLESLQDARSPQPFLLVVRRRARDLRTMLAGPRGPALVVVAHGVQDPGNLGAILRTADAAGATSFVVTGEGVDLHHPRVVRATMGSIFRLPYATTDLDTLFSVFDEQGIRSIATESDRGAPYDQCDLRAPIALLFGGEGGGLGAEVVRRAAEAIRIPMRPGVESLSVGAAAAVLLFEAARQRTRGALTPSPPEAG